MRLQNVKFREWIKIRKSNRVFKERVKKFFRASMDFVFPEVSD